jgi:peptidoglycan/xylan/chitin deacetylase (PgdA/CDA1 family)
MKSLTKSVKEDLKFCFALVYWFGLKLSHNMNRKVMLYYHGVTAGCVENFKKQMDWLLKHANVVGPSKIQNAGKGDKMTVAITFDDAFDNITDGPAEVLQSRHLPAGIFVPVGNLGEVPHWDIDQADPESGEHVMTDEQVVQMDRRGFEIFSHTLTHPRLTSLDDVSLDKELAESKHVLEDLLGHEVTGISYPHGDYDERVCEAAKKAGYKIGVTIEPHVLDETTDAMAIGRCVVDPKDNMLTFMLKVAGAYDGADVLRTAKNKFLSLFRTGGELKWLTR